MSSITKHFFRKIIIGANVAIIIIMLFIGFSDRLNPATAPMLSSAGLLFPFALAANFFFLVLWIFVKKRLALLPMLGYVICYLPIRTYCPFNIPKDTPDGAIKVLSYNVRYFVNVDENDTTTAMDYIKYCNADVVSLQEAIIDAKLKKNLGEIYPYMDSVSISSINNSVIVLSKFPIVKKERIEYPSVGNLSGAFYVKTDCGTVLVINNHFETSGLSQEERKGFQQMVHGNNLKSDTLGLEPKRLLLTLSESARKRAPQAEAVARYIRQHEDNKIILCGDFNDNPISYTHHTIANELADCYVESGTGPGWSYNQSSMKVRIDNIFCSRHWEPFNCNVDKKISVSDHYPIICWLKLRDNK